MKSLLFFLLLFFSVVLFSQNVAINDSGLDPNAHAILDLSAANNDKGILIPRITTGQRLALNSSLADTEKGLTVYDVTTGSFWYWNGTLWEELIKSGESWSVKGNTGTVRLSKNPLSFIFIFRS
jgi:hypothetical protein